jgi:tripartite-type tricarboxylate transporter receptor subunit TctC
MMMMIHKRLVEYRLYYKVVFFLCSWAFNYAAIAQSFPSRPIHVISEYVPGYGGDVLSRQIFSILSSEMGQPIVVENKGGSGGLIAFEATKRANADGYTILLASQNVPVTRRFLSKGEPVDATKDLTPITALWRTSLMVAINPGLPVKNLRDLIEYLKLNSGKVSFSSTGIGTQGHFAGASLSAVTGVNIVHVPYNDNRVITDVISGQVPMTISIVSNVSGHVRAGKLRLIASAGFKRPEAYPDLPLLTEVFPGFEPPPTWTGLFAPANLSKSILNKLNAAVVKALTNQDLKSKAAADGFDFIGNSPDEFVGLINHDIEVAGRLVKLAKIEASD